MSSTPTYTIVIPTRNRPSIFVHAVSSALAQTTSEPFEVLVSDNSTNGDTKEVIDTIHDDRVRYVRTPDDLPMHDSWEFALARARGEWITVLGDDDAISRHALSSAADVATSYGVEVVTWRSLQYALPGAGSHEGNEFVLHDFSGASRRVHSVDALNNLFRFSGDLTVPRMFNAICHRDVIARVIARIGRLFWPPAPDFTACTGILAVTTSYAFMDRPYHLASYGAAAPHESEEAFARFRKNLGAFTPISPIPLVSPCNQNAESFCQVKRLMGNDLAHISLDIPGYLRYFHRLLLSHARRGFDLSEERSGLARAVAALPPLERRDLTRQFRRDRIQFNVESFARDRLLRRPRTAARLSRITGRTPVRGDMAGFNDVAGAMAYLDGLLAAQELASTSR